MDTEIKKTPLYDNHVELGARIVDFHGWLMPIQYKGIVHEHLAVRKDAGIFDVSHMGEIEIKGKEAYAFVQWLVPNNLDKIKHGKVLYSCLCNERGGMVDDLIVYLFSKEHIMLVVNASNVDDDFNWIQSHKGKYKVELENISNRTSIIALQGPMSVKIMEEFLGVSLTGLKHFCFKEFTVSGNRILISRTGYTGEDGFELFIDSGNAKWLWENIMKFKPEPVGLGARDTLRLEKGYVLYGNDADINTTPIEAGISWTVDLNKKDFIGKDALLSLKPKKKLVRMEMAESGIPRQGCGIYCKNEKIGVVTSGTFSPSLSKGIAMGYIEKECEDIKIEIRGKLYAAKVSPVGR